MSNVNIPDLDPASSLNPSDLVEVFQGGVNLKTTIGDIRGSAQTSSVELSAVAGLNTTGLVERTGTATYDTVTVTPLAKTLLGNADAPSMLTTLGVGTSAVLDAPSNGNASTVQAVKGNDTRLSDARTPTAHKASHSTGGADAIAPADIGAASANHTQTLSTITDAGTAATKNAPNTGVNASTIQVVMGDDSRLSDARTPASHTHSAATESTAGFMSPTDKAKLDGMTSGTGIQSVNTKIPDGLGALTLAPSDIGASATGHTHTLSAITDAGSAASKAAPASGVNATTAQVVMGDDTRLSNSRTPTTHTHAVANDATDGFMSASDKTKLDGMTAGVGVQSVNTKTPSGLGAVTLLPSDIGAAAASHTHVLSDISDAGSAATKNAPNTGVNASTIQVVMGDDTRLSDARTPTAHTHTLSDISDAGSAAALNVPSPGNNASGLQLVRGDDTRLGSVSDSSITTAKMVDKAITYAKIQDTTAANVVLGQTGAAGTVQEIPCTAAGRALIAGADAAAQRATLGIGNVDNTSDTDKPVSTATTEAIAAAVSGISASATNARFQDGYLQIRNPDTNLWHQVIVSTAQGPAQLSINPDGISDGGGGGV